MSKYEVVGEYVDRIRSGEDDAVDNIKWLVNNDSFLSNLETVDMQFFEGRLGKINEKNYLETIDFIKEVHAIKRGVYNDFNIWSKSRSKLEEFDKDLALRHDELNELLGFRDNGNGIYKSFLGEKRLIPFILNKFDDSLKETDEGMSPKDIARGIKLMCDTSTQIESFYEDDQNIVDGFQMIDAGDLDACAEWYESRSGVIIDLRKELIDRLRSEERFTVKSLNKLIEKHRTGKENQFKSYQQTYSIVFPVFTFYGHDAQRKFVQNFTRKLIVDLELEGEVKDVWFDFQGVRQQGSDRYWVAIYNKVRENQSESLQFFFEFHKGKIGYGVYRHKDESYLKPKKLLGPEEFSYQEMVNYFYAERSLLISDKPDYGKLNLINLDGHKLYKVSHGSFKQKKYQGVVERLKSNNWIVIHENTKKGQADDFKNKLAVGDFVYITLGSNELIGIAKVVSDECSYLPEEIFDEEPGWIYREVELLAPAVRKSPKELKDKRNHYPSGNSTFSEVPEKDLSDANKLLFQPYFNAKFIDNMSADNAQSSDDLNHILFGPPGTGKTYNTINTALELCGIDIKDKKRKEVKSLFEAKVKEGRIVFTTFHQSMTYEDFIEGIKPKSKDGSISYVIEDGIFKQVCYKAMYAHHQHDGDEVVTRFQEFDQLFDEYVSNLQTRLSEQKEDEPLLLPLRTDGYYTQVKDVNEEESYVLTRGNGANSDVKVSKDKLRLVYNEFDSPEEIKNVSDDIRSVGKGLGWSSNYYGVFCDLKKFESDLPAKKSTTKASYEDYEKIKSFIENEGFPTKYKNDADKFVVIIDEINRGNISQIFGELITLLENDKRLGKDEGLDLLLPYSKKEFGVPPNVYVLGTMNTADRSVEALDSALRRRFSFKEMPPDSKLIKTAGKSIGGKVEDIDLVALLDVINQRVEKLLDKDHMIGHSYFLPITGVKGLKLAFHNKIIPLLQEYFYGDIGKIGLIIGAEFFELNDKEVDDDFFAPFEDYESGSLLERKVYHLRDVSKMAEKDFKSAVLSLMRKR